MLATMTRCHFAGNNEEVPFCWQHPPSKANSRRARTTRLRPPTAHVKGMRIRTHTDTYTHTFAHTHSLPMLLPRFRA